jgi:uncharacterized protein YndB with AHSA1/START domain
MAKLFVDKSIEVNASLQRVWDVLTQREHTAEWASEFSAGGPGLYIESGWDLGSPVLWKDKKGRVVVEGVVTALERHSLLRFTVFDVREKPPQAALEDGITFKLTERDGRTTLWVSQGDFAHMSDGEQYRDLSAEIWDRALARVKRLAEHPGRPA